MQLPVPALMVNSQTQICNKKQPMGIAKDCSEGLQHLNRAWCEGAGLDARAAAIVVRTLCRITETGRTITATVHQPATEVFEVCLLPII